MAENFGGVEHRIEFVRELDGVKWYNDSIATSPTRVLAGLNSFDQKLIVIAGGYDKKIPFEPMAETVNQKVKKLILMGVTAEKIEKAVTECSSYNSENLEIYHVSSMEEAVQKVWHILCLILYQLSLQLQCFLLLHVLCQQRWVHQLGR